MLQRWRTITLVGLGLVLGLGCGPEAEPPVDTAGSSTGEPGTDTQGSPTSTSSVSTGPSSATSGSSSESTNTSTSPPTTTGATSEGSTSQSEDDTGSTGTSGGPAARDGIWISAEEIAQLPTSGPAWDALLARAEEPAGPADLSDQDSPENVNVLARAFVCVRLSDDELCDAVRSQIMEILETENGGRTLALGRELLAYIIAADLVGLSNADDATFRRWLDAVRFEDLDGRTLVSTHEDRPNNWGTHAGASRTAAALYLGDQAELDAAAAVFEGFLGNRRSYAEFSYGELSWQSDPDNPVGINPVGATIEGNNVDGVIPDDQRRGGTFSWPPPRENYVYEALQGALAQAVMLDRQGYDVWEWEDQALLRTFDWLHEIADFPAEGDDRWEVYLVNDAYARNFPVDAATSPGKNIGFTGWTHGR